MSDRNVRSGENFLQKFSSLPFQSFGTMANCPWDDFIAVLCEAPSLLPTFGFPMKCFYFYIFIYFPRIRGAKLSLGFITFCFYKKSLTNFKKNTFFVNKEEILSELL